MRKTRFYTKTRPVLRGNDVINIVTESFFQDSFGSPRKDGKLLLQSNPFTRTLSQNVSFSLFGKNAEWAGLWPIADSVGGSGGASTPKAQGARTRAYAKAYGSLRSKLYKDNASLGVTIGSYKQSADMIRHRYSQLIHLNEEYYRLFNRSLAIRRGDTQSIASAHLEYIFGWQPLAQDIWAAANTVIQLADVQKAVRGSGSAYWEWKLPSDPYRRGTESGIVKCTVGTLVTIQNPNRWLLERAGLLNPAAVAWDLVPWSFLVNMVTNLGQLVNSITDFAGLSFGNESVTTTFSYSGTDWKVSNYPKSHPGYGGSRSVYTAKEKGRTIGSISRPGFTFKMPRAEWETAAMLASLLTQRFQKVNRLLSV